MSEGRIGGRARDDGGAAPTLGAADWLSLAAAPAFAVMAALTAAHGGGPAELEQLLPPPGPRQRLDQHAVRQRLGRRR